MELTKYGKKIADGITVALCVIALSSFSLSFYSLYQMAVQHHIHPLIAWMWPLGLDAFMVASCITVIRFKMLKEDTRWAWILVAITTVTSVAFNVASVLSTNDALTWAIYALPPIVVFLSLEALIMVIKAEQAHNTRPKKPVSKPRVRKPASIPVLDDE